MNAKSAEKELATRQAELTALEAERAALAIELGALNNERNAAVRALARGGGSPERQAIMGLEKQMTPMSVKIEGLEMLLTEAAEAVAQAKAALEEVQSREAAATANAFEAQERAEGQALVAGIPGLLERISEAYAAVCLLVGEFAVAQVQVEDLSRRVGGVDRGPLEALRLDFIPEVTARLEAKGLRQFLGQGYYGVLPIWAMVQEDMDFMEEHGSAQVDQRIFYHWKQGQARAKFFHESQNKGG